MLAVLLSEEPNIRLGKIEEQLNQISIQQAQEAEDRRASASAGAKTEELLSSIQKQLLDVLPQTKKMSNINHNRITATDTTVDDHEQAEVGPSSDPDSHPTTASDGRVLWYSFLFLGFILFFSLGKIQSGLVYQSGYGVKSAMCIHLR